MVAAASNAVAPASRPSRKRRAAGIPFRVRSRLMAESWARATPAPVQAGAHPHISRPGQGGQGPAPVRFQEKQGLERHQHVEEDRVVQVAPHEISPVRGSGLAHRQGGTAGGIVGQVIGDVDQEHRAQAHLGPGGHRRHLLLEVGRNIGEKTPGQDQQAAKERQGPGIKAEAGQIGQQGPAHPADFFPQDLAVAPAQFLGRSRKFNCTQHLNYSDSSVNLGQSPDQVRRIPWQFSTKKQ